MKVFLVFLILLPFGLTNAQKIGELAPDKAPEVFPRNSWGVDVIFGEGGFGLGTFYRRSLSKNITGFIDFSISETKDDREITYIDYWGNQYSPNKVNRAFLFPVNVGLQYRLFSESLVENLRPYIMFGVGPSLILTTPYDKEFFTAFGDAKTHLAIGGYVGMGTNIGVSKTSLIGLNVRYYYTHLLGDGIELMTGNIDREFGQFSLMLTLGIMY